MVSELTVAQEEARKKYRAEWFGYGICTDRADREKAVRSMLILRKEAGINTEPCIIWGDSPVHCLKLIAAAEKGNIETIEELYEKAKKASIDKSRRPEALWGQMEAYWIAFYLFCQNELGVKYEEQSSILLNLWADIAKSCCWWWCFDNWLVISERPTVVKMDDRERLHCADGPALAFQDDYRVWAWHGVRVPQAVIENPDSVHVDRIIKETNIEVRRIMLERVGLLRFLKESNAQIVHKESSKEYLSFQVHGSEEKSLKTTEGVKVEVQRELYRLELSGEEPIVAVHFICPPTGREYFLRVPPATKTCQEAVAWSFGMEPREYSPEQES